MSTPDAQRVLKVAQIMCPEAYSTRRARSMVESAMTASRGFDAEYFAETLLRSHEIVPFTGGVLHDALAEAEGWAEHGYSAASKAYWSGMRDTLRVLLGITTTPPTETGPGTDTAAVTIFGARQRHHGKA